MKNRTEFVNKALFKSSLKSNYASFLIVSIGNALILCVVIFILSTLSINVTRDSMKNMFDSASLERQVKEASISLYLSYDEGIDAYEETLPILGESAPSLYEATYFTMETGNGKYDAIIEGAELYYEISYSSSSAETDDEKHSDAKTKVINNINNLIKDTSLSDEVKTILPYFLDGYLDEYKDNKSLSNNEIFKLSFDTIAKNYAETLSFLSNDQIENAINIMKKAFDVKDSTKYKEESIKIVDEIIDDISASLITFYTFDIPSEILLNGYIKNKDYYENNVIAEGEKIGYLDKLYIETLATIMGNLFKDNYYLEALPEFKVEYVTNDKGIPYYVDESGNEVEILSVDDRDKLVKVKSGMEKKSNLLEKKYKEILTGSDYTDSEIALAKEESASFYTTGYDFAYAFLSDYVKDKTKYYDESSKTTVEANIKEKVSSDLLEYARPLICKMFNVTSLDEITKEAYGYDGNDFVDKVNIYAQGAIASFESELKKCTEKGYDEKTSIFVSLVKASSALTDELPQDIYDKLYDLADRNLYGLVIGCMFYSMAGLLLPMVYAILTSNSLIASEVEDGSMAFTLSSPIKRSTIIRTKAIYQISAITAMYLLLLLSGIAAREISILLGAVDFETSLTITDLCLYTLGSYLVILAVSSICFFSSAYFNKTKYSMGVGGGLTIFFLVTSILGLFGLDVMPLALRIDAMNIFNYVTIVRLFDVQAILDGNNIFYIKCLVLVAITIIFYGLSEVVFRKKDLPL